MKSLVFTLFSLLLLATACNTPKAPKANNQDNKKAVANVLEKYVIANENQDFSMIEQIWAPDSDIILFGTNSEEKLMGWTNIKKAIKQQFASISETYISPSSQFIKLNPMQNTAWFAEILNYNFVYQGKARSFEGVRFTGVMEKQKNGWKIVQAHLSIPAHINLRSKK
ncbi:hypothetical protein MNBD_BACTEROID07-47 [hydrothermal vent metagenome]|uniref:SnoaL-like domain-containing protein n=1 Tax=hydrothermal vent metagenome TaxID=652676 RepID=A0A3B0U636_9ZZZZ